MFLRPLSHLVCVTVISFASVTLAAAEATGPLKIHPTNPRYFTDDGQRAIYLTGSHTWNTIVDRGEQDPPPPFDFPAYLDFLDRHHHNFARLWTWEITAWGNRPDRPPMRTRYAAPMPYARTGPGDALDGKPKYDLTKYDPEYFSRLRDRAKLAHGRGIYVSVMLFEGYGLQFYADAWRHHPYNGSNNIQNVEADADQDGYGVEVHELRDQRITALQEAYVRKVIDAVNDLPNVMYEISNENHAASTEWQFHMVRYIKKYESTKPHQHLVGMTFQYKGGSNETLWKSPADWVSPNAVPGDYHWRSNPMPADGKKIVLSDTDHLWGVGGDVPWVWKTFTRGHHPIFMDPYGRKAEGQPPDQHWDPVRKNMGHTLHYARRMNLAAMVPSETISSSRFALASTDPARPEILAYLPSAGVVTLDLTKFHGTLDVEWLDPDSDKTQAAEPVHAGQPRELRSPFPAHSVVYLTPQRHH